MDIVVSVVILLFSVVSFIISYFQFKEKGYLFNNAYIWASKKEREAMNKKPHYRQSAIVFAMIGLLFLVLAVEMIVHSRWLYYVEFIIMVLLILYAIISSIAIEKKRK